MSDWRDDLIEDETEKLETYFKLEKSLGNYSPFTIHKYSDNLYRIQLKIGILLDGIVELLLLYSVKEIKDKDIFKKEIKDLIENTFYLNQPDEMKIPSNQKLYLNHFLSYMVTKLSEVFNDIP